VAFLLAFVYKALKPMQDANVELDVKKQVLYSLNIRDLDGSAAEAKYAELVNDTMDFMGQKILMAEINEEPIVIFEMKGMGLWGGISGFMATHFDQETMNLKVYGAYFNHESETPETQVDCVTGATLTSNGVDEMIKRAFGIWTGEYDIDMDEGELEKILFKYFLGNDSISDAEVERMIKVKKVKEE
jgi:Na+-transporting NADH:ubiquinone oxidoreductase subunit C